MDNSSNDDIQQDVANQQLSKAEIDYAIAVQAALQYGMITIYHRERLDAKALSLGLSSEHAKKIESQVQQDLEKAKQQKELSKLNDWLEKDPGAFFTQNSSAQDTITESPTETTELRALSTVLENPPPSTPEFVRAPPTKLQRTVEDYEEKSLENNSVERITPLKKPSLETYQEDKPNDQRKRPVEIKDKKGESTNIVYVSKRNWYVGLFFRYVGLTCFHFLVLILALETALVVDTTHTKADFFIIVTIIGTPLYLVGLISKRHGDRIAGLNGRKPQLVDDFALKRMAFYGLLFGCILLLFAYVCYDLARFENQPDYWVVAIYFFLYAFVFFKGSYERFRRAVKN